MRFSRLIPVALSSFALSSLALGAYPGDWEGRWSGTCELSPPVQGDRKIRMDLEVGAPDSSGRRAWRMVYDGRNTGRVERPYSLLPGRRAGSFLLDEGNGIFLEVSARGNVTHSAFEVAGKLITVREELRDGKILIEMPAFGPGRAGAHGVADRPLLSRQDCVLERAP